jgi:hypothetical protein
MLRRRRAGPSPRGPRRFPRIEGPHIVGVEPASVIEVDVPVAVRSLTADGARTAQSRADNTWYVVEFLN